MKRDIRHHSENVFRTAALIAVTLAGLSACTSVKETGRLQVMMSDSATDAREGTLVFQQIKSRKIVSKDPGANAAVSRVGRRLIAVIPPKKNTNWEFVVFKDSEPNAFALPGGKVGVNSGLLALTKNDAGMAAVLGHEMTHVTARHSAEEKSQNLLATVGGVALSVGMAVADVPPILGDVASTGYDVATKVGVLLPYSRTQEYEADRVGLLYMARAGYDPREAITFWKRMKAWGDKKGGNKVPAFLSTHPLDTARIKKLEKYLPEAMQEYEKSRKS